MGPLKGIKVIDMTTVLMGPYANPAEAENDRDLLQDVDAVLLAVDHPRDAAHLTLESPQSVEQHLAVFRVAVPDMFRHTP